MLNQVKIMKSCKLNAVNYKIMKICELSTVKLTSKESQHGAPTPVSSGVVVIIIVKR